MKKIPVKRFKTRQALERHILSNFGLDTKDNRAAATIQGSADELKNFSLGENTLVYGVPCVVE